MAKKNNNQFKSVDKLSRELDVVDNFVLRNWKRYTYLAIGVIIVIAGILFFSEAKATTDLQESQEIFTAKTPVELQSVIKKFPKSESVDYSRLNLAAQYFDKKEYDKALAVYKDEIDNGADSFAIDLAAVNQCYVLAAKGDNENAVASFNKIADNQNLPEFLRAESAYSSGRILMGMNKKDEALKYLNLCVSFKNSQGWGKLAKGILDTNA